jgi:hypothetical protein
MILATIFPFVKYIPGDPCRIKRSLSNTDIFEDHLREIIRKHKETYDDNALRDFIDVYLKKMRSEKSNPNTTFDGNYKAGLMTAFQWQIQSIVSSFSF